MVADLAGHEDLQIETRKGIVGRRIYRGGLEKRR
jgi:hypothetical protein